MNSSSITRRQSLAALAGMTGSIAWPHLVTAKSTRQIPAVPGELSVNWRRREKSGAEFRVLSETVKWKASETAIIICDMWCEHPCRMAARRVELMAPRMNEIVSAARDLGVAIIHAPSGGMKLYDDTPFRERIKDAQPAKPPVPIKSWCYHNPEREGKWPIVDNIARGKAKITGCDDPTPIPHFNIDRHQHAAIKIMGYDVISDQGQEVYNFLEQEGRKNVVLMGVHTNMCVLGRSFGIRQQKYLGKNVVLCRDLTDGLYDPRDPPFVSHTRGVELIIEHIEKYWCPSILGESLTKVIPGTAGPLPTP